MKSPNWREEELILAVNFYMEHGRKWVNSSNCKSPDIINFSNLLRNLTLFSEEQKEIGNFRSPNSVHMKLMNFKGIDQDNTSDGLRNSSILDRQVWTTYAHDPDLLCKKATAIISEFSSSDATSATTPSTDPQTDIFFTKLSEAKNSLEILIQQFCTAREKAIFIKSIDESQRIMNLMYEYISQLLLWNKTIDDLICPFSKDIGVLQDQKTEQVIQEIERIVVSPKQMKIETEGALSQEKIGQYIITTFSILTVKSLLSSEDVSELSNGEWCKANFHLGYAFLKKINITKPLDAQAYEGGYQRYWIRPFHYKSSDYLLCKEWYERNRKYYNIWLSKFAISKFKSERSEDIPTCQELSKTKTKRRQKKSETSCGDILFSPKYSSINLNVDLLKATLLKIKELDARDIYVKTGVLVNEMTDSILAESSYQHPSHPLNSVINFLKDINGNRTIPFVFNHRARYNNARDIQIFTKLDPGDFSDDPKIADIMPYTNRNGIFRDKYYRLSADKPCKTITAHMKYDCNMYIHPNQARGLTPREAARIQTYPDDYFFCGSYTKTYMQIGNSVPPLIAKTIAEVIKNHISSQATSEAAK